MTKIDIALASLEDCGPLLKVGFKPQDHLYFSDSAAMTELWEAMETADAASRTVVLIQTPEDFLAPHTVDEFWQSAADAPLETSLFGNQTRPHSVRAAAVAVTRFLEFLGTIPALVVVSCQGQVDFDLLGLLLACNYRICTEETTFVNRTLERNVPPGSATPWFLSRILGYGRTQQLYLKCTSLTANEALELGIMDQAFTADRLQAETLEVAEHFATKRAHAVRTLGNAMDLLNLDLPTFLNRAGSGFDGLLGADPRGPRG